MTLYANFAQFRRGFSDFCCDAGLSTEAARALILAADTGEKQAFFNRTLLNTALVHARRAGRAVPGLLRNTALVAAPVAAGAAAGAGAAGLSAAGGLATQTPNLYLSALPYMVGLGGAAGLALGSGVGHGLSALDDEAETPEQIKAKELAATYQTYADQIRAKRKYRENQGS